MDWQATKKHKQSHSSSTKASLSCHSLVFKVIFRLTGKMRAFFKVSVSRRQHILVKEKKKAWKSVAHTLGSTILQSTKVELECRQNTYLVLSSIESQIKMNNLIFYCFFYFFILHFFLLSFLNRVTQVSAMFFSSHFMFAHTILEDHNIFIKKSLKGKKIKLKSGRMK